MTTFKTLNAKFEATVFGGAQLPFEKAVTMMMSSVVSRSSFPLFVVFFRTVVASEIASRLWWCSSVLLFLFFSRRESAKERERERYAHKSMHVNLEHKRRDV